ncbi:hypothetical protein KM043_009357 [Ampulex compressa]|nr:hypothetical protein KM043_009357 [Ampulex compressa]
MPERKTCYRKTKFDEGPRNEIGGAIFQDVGDENCAFGEAWNGKFAVEEPRGQRTILFSPVREERRSG